MFKKRIFTKGLIALSLFGQHAAWAQKSSMQVERPTQFVMFAYDGSYNNDVWNYSRQFSLNQKKELGEDKAVHFTYFINPVYLLIRETGKKYYTAPGKKAGQSNIGWGDDKPDIEARIDHMNDAYLEGHEIGSHTVGHFDGSKWSQEDWESEFSSFNFILNNVFSLEKINRAAGLMFQRDIVGFRAPQLGVSSGLWPTLKKFGFKYDTSKVNTETYWPKKNSEGLWNFPLAEIEEPGASLKWISMDYNFCARDSWRILAKDPSVMDIKKYDSKKGKMVLANTGRDCLKQVPEQYKQNVKANMLKMYRSYFNKNYYGNRAPIHIGHHFSSWMSGAYYEAFFEFANEVCRKPEVKCGTYTELMKFLESRFPGEIEAYQKGAFAKLPRPKAAKIERHWDLSVNMSVENDAMMVSLSGADAKRSGLSKEISIGGFTKEIGSGIKLDDIRLVTERGETATVRVAVKNRTGKEVSTATYKIENVGTEQEKVNTENIEFRWLEGHLPEAHADEVDFTRGH